MLDRNKLDIVVNRHMQSLDENLEPTHSDIPRYLVEAAYGSIMTVVKKYVESHPNPPDTLDEDREDEYKFYRYCKYLLEESGGTDIHDRANAISRLMEFADKLLW